MEASIIYPATAAHAQNLRAELAACGVSGARVRRMPNGRIRLVLASTNDRDAARDALVMTGACNASGVSFVDPSTTNSWNGPTEIFIAFLEA